MVKLEIIGKLERGAAHLQSRGASRRDLPGLHLVFEGARARGRGEKTAGALVKECAREVSDPGGFLIR